MAFKLKTDIYIEEAPDSDNMVHYTTVYADTEEELVRLCNETVLPRYYNEPLVRN